MGEPIYTFCTISRSEDIQFDAHTNIPLHALPVKTNILFLISSEKLILNTWSATSDSWLFFSFFNIFLTLIIITVIVKYR